MLKEWRLIQTFVVLVSLCFPFSTRADDNRPASPVATFPPQAPEPSRAAVSPSVNGVTQATVNAGVLTCASRINQVANFLTDGTQGAGALLFIPPANPDQRLISVSMEIPAAANAPVAYASASVAPNQANGCGGMYESVIYWSQSCESVATGNFGELKQAGPLAKTITVLDGGIWTKVFLMPAGAGCVSIKKEIVR